VLSLFPSHDHDGDTNTYFGFSGLDTFRVAAGGQIGLVVNIDETLVSNHDFRLSVTGSTHQFYFNEDNGNIGFGTSTPLQDVQFDNQARFNNVAQDDTATQIAALDSNNDLVWVDKATIGGGVNTATSSIDEVSWSGNTIYAKDITVTGAVVGDYANASLTDAVFDAIEAANIEYHLNAWVSAADTVRVMIRTSGFISVPASSEWIVIHASA